MTKNDLMIKVFEIIKQRHNDAIWNAEQNLLLAQQNADFVALQLEERKLNFELGKAKFENVDTAQIQKQIGELNIKKTEILKQLNLSIDDMRPRFVCKKCNDMGYFDGKICSCASQIYNNLLMQKCGVKLDEVPNLNDYDFKFFAEKDEIDYAKKCVKILKDYVENFDHINMKNIVLCGASGTGKTYLAKCLAKELLQKNYTTLFLSAFELGNMFLEEHTSQLDEKTHLRDLAEIDVLIIDDLGTEPIRRNVTKEYLLLLLNERLSNNKSTIITTNLMPMDILDRYEERIFSRMLNKRSTLLVEFKGKNNRLKK